MTSAIGVLTGITFAVIFVGLRFSGESLAFSVAWSFLAAVVIPYGVATLVWIVDGAA